MPNLKSKSKLLVFDFDGTIADTKAVYYQVIHDKLKNFGYSYKQIDKVMDLGISLKRTLKRLGCSFIVSWFLHKQINRKVIGEVKKVKKCKDVDSIKHLKEDKLLVSNSLKEFIVPIVKHFKLKKQFKGIYGADDFSNKASFIKKYIKDNNLKKENCYYIGDVIPDIKIARKVGCKSIVIAGKCAWDSRAELLKEGPDFIVSSLKDLKKVVK